MSKKLYVAYSSNLNKQQMKYRCPTAKLYGTGVIENYELQFKGQPYGAYATIAPKEGSSVPVAVWEIQPRDEVFLDRYEGYPSHYFKLDIPVQLDGEEVDAMVYIMNLKMNFGLPSPYYYQTVCKGYNDCELDTDVLDRAVMVSVQNFYSSAVRPSHQQSLFDYESEDGNKVNEDFTDEELVDEEEMEESDSFYFFDGVNL